MSNLNGATGSILIVDDSAMVRRQVGSSLRASGYEVCEAVDGLDAIEKITPQSWPVVCDVTIPRMDGIQFLETLRANGAHATLPVIMLTTEGRPDMIAKARALGTIGWLIKPFKPEHLLSTVQALERRVKVDP